jgi:tellurite methyltransferase
MENQNSWDLHWANESNRAYWVEPDKTVVEMVGKLDRSIIRNVLDLGCGTGRHTLFLAQAGFEVSAVDSSPEALSILGKQINEKGIRVNVLQGDYFDDLFAGDSFDFVLAYNVIYHGSRDSFRNTIRLIRRWLKPGGWFFFTCPTRQDDKFGNGEQVAPNTFKPLNSIHPGDIHYFAGELEIQDILEGFEIVSQYLDAHFWNNHGNKQFNSYRQILARKTGKSL